jgi:hypothetical protein
MRVLASILSACLLAAATVPVGAQVYRWTDERGGITYGNHPPPSATRLTRLDGDGVGYGFPSISASRHHKTLRELPGVAVPAPSEFPGTVDRRTLATMDNVLAWQDCASRRARCGQPAAAGALPETPFSELSALRVP